MATIEDKLRQDLERFKDALQQIQAEIGSMMNEEQGLEEKIRYIREVLGEDNGQHRLFQDSPSKPPESPEGSSIELGNSTADVIEKILRTTGTPMRIRDMVKHAIREKMSELDERKLFSAFSGVLAREKKKEPAKARFRRIRRGVFALSLARTNATVATVQPQGLTTGGH